MSVLRAVYVCIVCVRVYVTRPMMKAKCLGVISADYNQAQNLTGR
jgi:hypothetical protein